MEKASLVFLRSSLKLGARVLDGKGKPRVAGQDTHWGDTSRPGWVPVAGWWGMVFGASGWLKGGEQRWLCHMLAAQHWPNKRFVSVILFHSLPLPPTCLGHPCSEVGETLLPDFRVIQGLFEWDSLHHSFLFFFFIIDSVWSQNIQVILKILLLRYRLMIFFRVTLFLNVLWLNSFMLFLLKYCKSLVLPFFFTPLCKCAYRSVYNV